MQLLQKHRNKTNLRIAQLEKLEKKQGELHQAEEKVVGLLRS